MKAKGTIATAGAVIAILATASMAPIAAATDVMPTPFFASPAISERNLSAGAGWFHAYTANSKTRPAHYNAWLFEGDSGAKWKLNDNGTTGQAGGFSGNTVVFTQRQPGRARNLFKVDNVHLGAQSTSFPAKVNTPADEFDPTISGSKLLFTRHTASTDTFRVMVYDRQTRELQTLARATGNRTVRAGQINGDWATWQRTTPSGSDVYRYQLSSALTEQLSGGAFDAAYQYNSAVAPDGTVYFHRRGQQERGQSVRLMRAPVGSPTEVLYHYLRGLDGGRAYATSTHLYFTVTTVAAPPATADDTYFIPTD